MTNLSRTEPNPRDPVMIGDVLVGIQVDEVGNDHVVVAVMSNTKRLPIYLFARMTIEEVKDLQVALGRKLRALRD